MPNRVQSLRSSVAGNRPVGRLPGELYVNWPDGQFGAINSGGNPQDLIAVRFFSSTANYNIGDFTISSGQLYRATAAVSAGAFNPAQWTQVGGSVTVGDALPTNPQPGSLWWDSVGGQLYVYYNDGNTTQWVIANNFNGGAYLPLGGGTLTGPLVLAGNATANLNPVPLQQLPLASTTPPVMDGVAAIGASTAWAKADHVHPSDTSRAPLVGVTDGSNAAAGQVGEFLSTSFAGTSLASGQQGSCSSLNLSPGDWEVWGNAWIATLSGTAASYFAVNVGSVVSSVTPPASIISLGAGSLGVNSGLEAPRRRFNLTATTVIYLGVDVIYSSGTMTVSGNQYARRMR